MCAAAFYQSTEFSLYTQYYQYYRKTCILFNSIIDLVSEVPAHLTSRAHILSWFQSGRWFKATSEVSLFSCHLILRVCTFDEPFSVQNPALLWCQERETNNVIKKPIMSSNAEFLIIMEILLNWTNIFIYPHCGNEPSWWKWSLNPMML